MAQIGACWPAALVTDDAADFVSIELSDPVASGKSEGPSRLRFGKVSVRLDAERVGGADRGDRDCDRARRMIIPAQGLRIVLAVRPVDFRCGHDALAGLVQNTLGLDPHSGLIVVFRSKRADRLKILLWDGTGLVLVYKRLGPAMVVSMARRSATGVMHLTRVQFEALFEG
ncbi:IS66 family insertion sequence element accessory protein TnpB [Bradyrhizobium diazoefficiens]|uniref:IS66 family insertion sequence element accessory protein TnpB n=1 Tax=Bradyrhizobium diazoefficiens TaxID=1355477 RepID=UPI00272A3B7C|nr:IS66 family insertion sequence element accessory protein TnpB [Bradyrhizobium diazoefficiens]WLA64882.1 IS66 family insertion sequence element accessory protein TnpB [Bradyrhizobium diazoefficiens]